VRAVNYRAKKAKMRLPKKRKTTAETAHATIGGSSSRLSRLRFKRPILALFIVTFIGAGYLIVNSFASSTCQDVCVDLPEVSSTKSEDFHIRTRVRFLHDRSSYNVKVILDKGSPNEQVVDIRTSSTLVRAGSPAREYNFFYGSLSSGSGNTLVFDRQLLAPGNHTITAEMRTGDAPGQGTLYASDTNTFRVTNVKNLMTSREAPRTFYAKQLPKYGSSAPRAYIPSFGEKFSDSVAQAKPALDKLSSSFSLVPKASAHSGTGYRHGNIDVIAILPDGSRLPGVTVSVRHAGGILDGCHSGNTATTHLPGGDANFRDCAVTNNGCSGDPSCSATYTITVSNTPAGYSLNDVATKNMTVVWQQNRDIHFNYKVSENPVNNANNPSGCGSISSAVVNPQPANYKTALYRYWNPAITNHIYITTRHDVNMAGQGYCYEGIEGYLYPNKVPGTVPLCLYYSHPRADHFYTIDCDDGKWAGHTYTRYGQVGYVDPISRPGYNTPLHRYWNAGWLDHFYTITPNNYGGYAFEGYEGYVYKSPGVSKFYLPTQPPLLAMTNLTSTQATINAFGLGLDEPGNTVRMLAVVQGWVDGKLVSNVNLNNPVGEKTVIGVPVGLGNLNDGHYHTVEIRGYTFNGQVATVKFNTDPHGPYTSTPSSLSYRSTSLSSTGYNEESPLATASSIKTGTINARAYLSSGPKPAQWLGTPIPNLKIYTENINATKHCGSSDVTPFRTTSTGSIKISNCPVGQSNGPNYPKSYYVYAVIPPGYTADPGFAKVNYKTVTVMKHPRTGENVIRRKITVTINNTSTRPRTVSFIFAPTTTTLTTPEAYFLYTEENQLGELINQERAVQGAPPLKRLQALDVAAKMYSYQMWQFDFFSHTGYSGSDTCTTGPERYKQYELPTFSGNSLDEIIGTGKDEYGNPGWLRHNYMNSDGHRRIIVNPKFRSYGIGTIRIDNWAGQEVYVNSGVCTITSHIPRQNNQTINTVIFSDAQ
jgi:uncharacterized protein YkwD